MSNTLVRDLTPADIPTYFGMMKDLAAHTGDELSITATEAGLHDKFFNDPKVFGRILEVDYEVVGFTTWWVTFASWFATHGMWLCEIYVRPEVRKRGYGSILIEDLKAICRERDFHGIGWWMSKNNAEAAAFYDRIGAKRNDSRDLYGLRV